MSQLDNLQLANQGLQVRHEVRGTSCDKDGHFLVLDDFASAEDFPCPFQDRGVSFPLFLLSHWLILLLNAAPFKVLCGFLGFVLFTAGQSSSKNI